MGIRLENVNYIYAAGTAEEKQSRGSAANGTAGGLDRLNCHCAALFPGMRGKPRGTAAS